MTALESARANSSLYAQIDPKKKRQTPSHQRRFSGRTKSVDPTAMTKSLTGLEELTRRKTSNFNKDSRYTIK